MKKKTTIILVLNVLILACMANDSYDHLKNTNFIWSIETNFMGYPLRSGVYIRPNTNKSIIITTSNKVVSVQALSFITTSSNEVLYFYPRNIEEYIDMKMIDENGKEIEKTERGKNIGIKANERKVIPSVNFKYRGLYFAVSWSNISDFIFANVLNEDLPKYFKITKPGKYNLIIIQRGYIRNPVESKLIPFDFPPVIVPVLVIE